MKRFVASFRIGVTKMTTSVFNSAGPFEIDKIPLVEIDADGKFKYILIDVVDHDLNVRTIVRGKATHEYHADIFDEVDASLTKQKIKCRCTCLGGGRIEHFPHEKKLKVYGYSVGFGPADHKRTVQILKTAYPDYEILITDDEY